MSNSTSTTGQSATIMAIIPPYADNLEYVALRIAPSLKDKFDLSSDEDFEKWADLSFKAAKAFYKRTEAHKKDIENACRELALQREREAKK